jgi:hypothetical protein
MPSSIAGPYPQIKTGIPCLWWCIKFVGDSSVVHFLSFTRAVPSSIIGTYPNIILSSTQFQRCVLDRNESFQSFPNRSRNSFLGYVDLLWGRFRHGLRVFCIATPRNTTNIFHTFHTYLSYRRLRVPCCPPNEQPCASSTFSLNNKSKKRQQAGVPKENMFWMIVWFLNARSLVKVIKASCICVAMSLTFYFEMH